MTDRQLRERVREDVDRRLATLRERFGPFPVAEETVENEPALFEAGRSMAADGWRGDAGAFVTDPEGRLLLVRHADAPDAWGVPGGAHEPWESFAGTARREVREETGVDCAVTDVWRARRRTFVHADEPERRLEMLTVWFEADVESGPTVTGDDSDDDFEVSDDEIVEARWFECAPEVVHEEFVEWVEAWRGPSDAG